MPLVALMALCIAPDLIGFGQSGKSDIEYRFAGTFGISLRSLRTLESRRHSS